MDAAHDGHSPVAFHVGLALPCMLPASPADARGNGHRIEPLDVGRRQVAAVEFKERSLEPHGSQDRDPDGRESYCCGMRTGNATRRS